MNSPGEQVFDAWWPRDAAGHTALLLLAVILAVGAALRFWGLGSIGLHGDEDVMAMATRGILETGEPIIPSGMFYPRGLPQLYLMAASVAAFGDSEWALRLPSAIMGTLMILVGYWLARRFLTVSWSIAFAATIALLPSFIAISQTARMYVFFVTFVMLFAVLLFRWERTESTSDYLYAVAACIIALTFHTLAVFAAMLFFYPGLVKGSRRLLVMGAVAFVVCVIVFKGIAEWSSAQYFPLVSRESGGRAVPAVLYSSLTAGAAAIAVAIVALAAAGAWIVGRRRRPGTASLLWFVSGSALLAGAVVLAFLVQFHMAAFAWLLGAIFYVRARGSVLVPAVAAALLLGLLGLHAWEAWRSPEVRTLYDLAESLMGMPKPLPYLTFLQFAPIALVLYALMTLYFAARFANGKPLPDHSLFFLITVLAPLFIMGFLEENYIPERYISGMVAFFILAMFAGVRFVITRPADRHVVPRPAEGVTAGAAVGQAAAAVVTLAIIINPPELVRNVSPEYADFQYLTGHRGVDHKGAAEYVKSRGSDEEDLVIVVDSQQHGYYLRERMDFYMRSLHEGRNSSIMRGGKMLNLYTGTPQISTGDQLAELVRESGSDEILVVGSGEIEDNRMRYMSDGIWSTMQELGFEEAWLGRDGATPVWRYHRTEPRDAAAQPGAAPNDTAAGDAADTAAEGR